jgi:hypothetical protein
MRLITLLEDFTMTTYSRNAGIEEIETGTLH